MLRNNKILLFIVLVLVVSGCAPKDPHADLYGTWSSDVVAVSGAGHFDGVSNHEYGEDGTYRWEIDFTPDAGSGCRYTFYYAGTFSGDEMSLHYTATDGEIEVSSCADASSNAPSRSFEQEELATASTSTEWSIDGDTLSFLHEDGLDRIYQRK